jgi:mono/diheme cytochrome c family protein
MTAIAKTSRHPRWRPFRPAHLLAGASVILGCVLIGATGTSRGRVLAQETGDAEEGRKLFAIYCASCHGATGVGNGPAAESMRRQPPDITELAMANGGVFPAARMGRIIDGRDIRSHGDREMPVWGDAFKAIPDGRSEDAVRGRIASILKYLATIQRRRA